MLQQDEITKLVRVLRQKKPELNIWLYTGYKFDDVSDLPLLQLVNVVVDGKYIEAKRTLQEPFRGSTNQKIIKLR